jgi:hypothetical protein
VNTSPQWETFWNMPIASNSATYITVKSFYPFLKRLSKTIKLQGVFNKWPFLCVKGEQFCNVWRGWSKLKIITSLRQILANLRLDAHTFNDICYLKVVRVKCNHYFKPSTQYKKHTIELSLAFNEFEYNFLIICRYLNLVKSDHVFLADIKLTSNNNFTITVHNFL